MLLAGRMAGAQVIVVDTSNDVIDFGGAQQVANLPGPDGRVSLPEAGLASDNTPGVQTIAFNIPPSEWLYQQFFPGRAVLKPFLGFRVFDTAILDGTTQTAFTGETNPDGGAEVVIWAEAYLIDNVGGAAFGFDNSSIHLSGGSGNVVQANTKTGVEVFDSHSNLIGGVNPGEGNTGGFIQIDRASDNVVVGNTVDRVRVLGWIGGGQAATNNRIGGPTPGERNYIIGLGTWNSEGWPSGFAMQLFDAIGTVIENNQIGTTPDGLHQGHLATTAGIYFDGENHDTLIRNNRIAGILGVRIGPYPGVLGTAISIYGTGDGVSIVGNAIGLDAHGEPVLGSVTGIATTNYYLGAVQNVVIGGPAAGAGNEVAGHLGSGISVANTFSGVRIAGNSIHENGGLGIDLITNGFLTGVTPNDPLDLDSGGNGLQNFPVLDAATVEGAAIHVTGTLHSTPLADFTVEVFASPDCDPSGFGEGQQFLGAVSVTTDPAGNAAIDAHLEAAVPAGWFVAATATAEPSGATSEFGACVALDGQGFASYCTAGTSASGCQATLSASGIPSAASPSGFALSAANVEGAKDGQFFFGTGGRQANSWGNGTSYQCVVPPLTRAGLLLGVGTNGLCDGSFSQDLNALWTAKPAKNPGAGALVQAQLWYRDPNSTSNQTTSFSDAIEFLVGP
jgi:hypothetical protein